MSHVSKSPPNDISWRAPEFIYHKKTLVWYTHMFVVFFLVVLVLMLIGNYAGLVIIAFLFWVFLASSQIKPRILTIKLDEQGISIGDRLIQYADIKSFAVDEAHDTSIIVLEPSTLMTLPTSLVIKKVDPETVIDYLSHNLPRHDSYSLLRQFTYWLRY